MGYSWSQELYYLLRSYSKSRSAVLGQTSSLLVSFEFAKSLHPNEMICFRIAGALYDYDNDVYGKYNDERFANVPSGHSSASIGFTLFLSLYLHAKVNAYLPASETDAPHDTIRMFAQVLCYLPTVFGMWICGTRLQDYWHSNGAVALGILLGGVCAVFSWNSCTAYYCTALWSTPGKTKNVHLPIHSKQVEGALKGM